MEIKQVVGIFTHLPITQAKTEHYCCVDQVELKAIFLLLQGWLETHCVVWTASSCLSLQRAALQEEASPWVWLRMERWCVGGWGFICSEYILVGPLESLVLDALFQAMAFSVALTQCSRQLPLCCARFQGYSRSSSVCLLLIFLFLLGLLCPIIFLPIW